MNADSSSGHNGIFNKFRAKLGLSNTQERDGDGEDDEDEHLQRGLFSKLKKWLAAVMFNNLLALSLNKIKKWVENVWGSIAAVQAPPDEGVEMENQQPIIQINSLNEDNDNDHVHDSENSSHNEDTDNDHVDDSENSSHNEENDNDHVDDSENNQGVAPNGRDTLQRGVNSDDNDHVDDSENSSHNEDTDNDHVDDSENSSHNEDTDNDHVDDSENSSHNEDTDNDHDDDSENSSHNEDTDNDHDDDSENSSHNEDTDNDHDDDSENNSQNEENHHSEGICGKVCRWFSQKRRWVIHQAELHPFVGNLIVLLCSIAQSALIISTHILWRSGLLLAGITALWGIPFTLCIAFFAADLFVTSYFVNINLGLIVGFFMV